LEMLRQGFGLCEVVKSSSHRQRRTKAALKMAEAQSGILAVFLYLYLLQCVYIYMILYDVN
jgi:hypothetical protein